MRNLIAVPVILLAVILQSAIVSRVTLLSGMADLPLVMLAAWAMQDEVETAWRIVDPIREAWSSETLNPNEFYAAGTWGPQAAEELLSKHGHSWRNPQPIA